MQLAGIDSVEQVERRTVKSVSEGDREWVGDALTDLGDGSGADRMSADASTVIRSESAIVDEADLSAGGTTGPIGNAAVTIDGAPAAATSSVVVGKNGTRGSAAGRSVDVRFDSWVSGIA